MAFTQPAVLVAVKVTDQLPAVVYVTDGEFDVDELGEPPPLRKLQTTPPPAFVEVLVNEAVAGWAQKLEFKGFMPVTGKVNTIICSVVPITEQPCV